MDKFNRSINNKKVTGGLILCLVVISGIGVYALTKPKTKPKEEKIEEVVKEDVKEEVTEKQETPVVNDNKETTSKSSNSSNSNQASNSKPSISNKTTKSTPGNTTSNTQAKPNHNVSKPATQKPNPSKSKPQPSTPKPSKPKVVTPNAIYDTMKPGDYIPDRLIPKNKEYKVFRTLNESKNYGEKMMDEDKWDGYYVSETHRNDSSSVWFVVRR